MDTSGYNTNNSDKCPKCGAAKVFSALRCPACGTEYAAAAPNRNTGFTSTSASNFDLNASFSAYKKSIEPQAEAAEAAAVGAAAGIAAAGVAGAANTAAQGANSGLYGTMAGRIGVPFSAQDVKNAVRFDLKEVRAVTPTYTYSIRRPKGGWGDARTAINALNKYENDSRIGARSYAAKQLSKASRSGTLTRQRAREISDRANVGTQYSEFKKMAKQLGWTFTRRKVK